jgi:hypothetical protein
VLAVGQHSGAAPATITATLAAVDHNGTTTLSRSIIQTQARECTNLSLTLQTTLVGAEVKIQLSVYSYRDDPLPDKRNFSIEVQPCPWAFKLDTDSGTCKCPTHFNYYCDLLSASLTIKHHINVDWIGCGRNPGDCTGKPVLYARGCGRPEYCNNSYRDITAGNVEALCAEHRTGILCGSCQPGWSVVLGTGRCKACPSSNKYLSLVVLYLAAGVLLIVILTKFRLTINSGSLNGFIFYANFIHWNRRSIFPVFRNSDILRLITAWLNLDLGIEVCFYNGMTAIHFIWLQIGYILYIVFLQVTIILLCRRYVTFTRFFGRNVTKVLSTLLTLLYAKALATTVSVFEYTIVTSYSTYRNHYTYYTFKVLSVDGNVRFGSPQHIPLLIVASLLALCIAMLMFSLLFIQLLIKVSSWRCFRWVATLQPFFETFTGHCNFSYAFWPGYLFFVKTAFLCFQLYFRQYNFSKTYAFEAGLVGSFTILLSFLGPKGVYKQWLLNILELSLILNLTIASFTVSGKKQQSTAVIIISIALALLQFLTFHMNYYISFSRIKKGITLCVKRFKKYLAKDSQMLPSPLPVTHTNVSISCHPPAERTPLLPSNAMPQVINYEDFREPLIENEN